MEAENYLIVSGKNEKLDTEEDGMSICYELLYMISTFFLLSIVRDIITEIESSVDLEVLNLSGNSYGTDAAKAIGRVLSKHRTLRRTIWSDMFVSRLKDEIPLALVNNLYIIVNPLLLV